MKGKPKAKTHEEYMRYQLPAFRLDRKALVLYGAATNHCSLYTGSGTASEP